MKNDIENRTDIEILINQFYAKVVKDDVISVFFNEIAPVNWEKHLPIMVGFWDFILFSTTNAYSGSVMTPHLHLHALKPFNAQHFERWLLLFNTSVDELFEGAKAEDAKLAAKNIGATMKYKLLGSNNKEGILIQKVE